MSESNLSQIARTAAEKIIGEFQSCLLVPDGYTHEMFYGKRMSDIIEAMLKGSDLYRSGVEDAKSPAIPSTFVLNVAQRDRHFRKWMIERLTKMGDDVNTEPLKDYGTAESAFTRI